MEPLLYHLEWDVALEVLFTLILLSFFAERALSLLFEHRLYDRVLGGRGLSEIIALAAAVLIVRYCEFDALAIIMRRDENDWLGYFVTGAIVAGGSKASIKLFHDLLDVRSAYDRAKNELMERGAPRQVAAEMAAAQTGPGKRKSKDRVEAVAVKTTLHSETVHAEVKE